MREGKFWKMAKVQYMKPIHSKRKERIKFVKEYNEKKLGRHRIEHLKERLIGKSVSQRIEALKRHSELVIFRRNPYELGKLRIKFNRIKWDYRNRWAWCFVCRSRKMNHIHHIIMLKNGGTNQKKNLVGLCGVCHSEIHEWVRPPKEPPQIYDLPMERIYEKKDPLLQEYLSVMSNQ